MDSSSNESQPIISSASKGKEVQDPISVRVQPTNISSKSVGPSKPNSEIPQPLEASLLVVKERIKKLEKGPCALTLVPITAPLSNPYPDSNHEEPSSFIVISTDQSQLACKPDLGRETTPIADGGGSISCLVQLTSNSQTHCSNSLSNLSFSFEGKSDSFNRSIQHSRTRIQFWRSKHRKEAGPYPNPEIQVFGEDPRYRQILNIAKEGGGSGTLVSYAPGTLPECNNDAITQGNQGANAHSGSC
ncbi:hypothetical protein SLA2020_254770 [Shorea laevis]